MRLTIYYDPLLHHVQRQPVKHKRSGPPTAYELEMRRWEHFDQKEFMARQLKGWTLYGPQSVYANQRGLR